MKKRNLGTLNYILSAYNWLNKLKINKYFTLFLLFLSFFASILTYLIFTNNLPNINSTPALALTILTIDLILILLLCFKVIRRIANIWMARKKGYAGSKILSKYVVVFSMLTLFPAIILTIFSTLFFNLGIKTWFGEKVQNIFKQSTSVADAYLNLQHENIRSDVIAIGNLIDNNFNVVFLDLSKLNNFINEQVSIRELTEGFIFKTNGNIIARAGFTISSTPDLITKNEIFDANSGKVIFTSKRPDRVRALVKLKNITNAYLVVGRFVDPNIINQVDSVKLAAKTYEELLDKRSRIEINFYMVFILISLLILFVAIFIALVFSDNLIKPISNLIHTSRLIKKGNLTAQVPPSNTKDEMSVLIKTFNQMTKTLQQQRLELRQRERNAAWSDIARRIAHEIKNPLTPIQLSAEQLKRNSKSKEFADYANTIIKQVGAIKKMVDEFSKFARLPKPKFHKCNLNTICNDIFFLHKKANPRIVFSNKSKKSDTLLNADESQITMAINNIIQNSIDSINEKSKKINKNSGRINLQISRKPKKIILKVNDNGIGLPNDASNKKILEPYITTKKDGTGLGLAIVTKIIEEHKGKFNIINNKNGGVSTLIELPKTI